MESKKARTGRLGWFAEMAAILVLLQIMCSAQIHFPARCENSHEGLLFQERDTLPFSLVDGYLIVVEGRIGANRHLRLVVDTGSTHSVLRSDFAGLQMFVRQPARIVIRWTDRMLEKVIPFELHDVDLKQFLESLP